MTDAPERILAWWFMKSKQNENMQGGWTNKKEKRETEYLRADLAAAAVAERDALAAENARLAATLAELDNNRKETRHETL